MVLKPVPQKFTPETEAPVADGLELAEKVSRDIRNPSYLLHPLLLDKANAVGIGGMRERVLQLGGELKIRPAPPGTFLEAWLPCD